MKRRDRASTKPLNGKNKFLLLQDPLFSKTDYAKHRDFSPTELFQLFFDTELCERMMKQLVLYAHSKGETNFVVSRNKIKVFLGILILYGLCPVSSRRLYRENDFVCRNTAVCDAMRRNR